MFCFNTWRPRQNGRSFADDTFKFIFLNENVRISIKNSLKFVPIGPIDNIPEFVHIMVWRRPGEKPLSEPMMVRLPTHLCVTRPQWVKYNFSEKRHARDAMLWVHPSSYLDFNITLIYYWFPLGTIMHCWISKKETGYRLSTPGIYSCVSLDKSSNDWSMTTEQYDQGPDSI